jgi:hypothetical protein
MPHRLHRSRRAEGRRSGFKESAADRRKILKALVPGGFSHDHRLRKVQLGDISPALIQSSRPDPEYLAGFQVGDLFVAIELP